MSLSNALGIVIAIFGIAGGLGGGWGLFLAGRQRATVSVLSGNNEALVARQDILETALNDAKANEVTCQERLAGTEAAIRALRDAVGGVQAIEALRVTTERQHRELLDAVAAFRECK